MNKRDLKKLSKSELIKMLLKQKKSKKFRNHEDLLDNDPLRTRFHNLLPYHKSLQDAFQNPLENHYFRQ